MGVAPYKTFTFDGVSSSTYGVYITGQGVFNAPQRAVEMIEIPGRNGNHALDQGRFENIEVTYKCGMFDVTESNFATKVSNFRNWICSKVGYVKLSDEYNPDEYRMAVYKNGLEVDHEMLIAGEFEITFECKPQRWLTSGETAVTVANNGTLSNPTLFDSEPLLAVKGYGTIGFNGYEIEIENVTLGEVVIADSESIVGSSENGTTMTYYIDTGIVNSSDTFTVNATFKTSLKVVSDNGDKTAKTGTISDTNANFSSVSRVTGVSPNTKRYFQIENTTTAVCSFTIGTASTQTNTATATITTANDTYWAQQKIEYTQPTENGVTKNKIVIKFVGFNLSEDFAMYPRTLEVDTNSIVVDSTASALGNPTYIDCDIGEAYMIKNSEIVSLNGVISLGSDLPKLASGTNTFTYDNTVTELKVTPRWWKV